jgi:hypothetical protein
MNSDTGNSRTELEPAYDKSKQSKRQEMPFLEPASKRINVYSGYYLKRLRKTARDYAKARKGSAVDVKDVDDAEKLLFATYSGNRSKKWAEMFAAVCFGAALTLLVSSSLLVQFQNHIMWACFVVGILLLVHSSSNNR